MNPLKNCPSQGTSQRYLLKVDVPHLLRNLTLSLPLCVRGCQLVTNLFPLCSWNIIIQLPLQWSVSKNDGGHAQTWPGETFHMLSSAAAGYRPTKWPWKLTVEDGRTFPPELVLNNVLSRPPGQPKAALDCVSEGGINFDCVWAILYFTPSLILLILGL